MGGSRGSQWTRIRNTFIIFLVSGFWHGANYTFIIWGAVHALLFLPLLLRGKNRRNTDIPAEGRWAPGARESASILLTFAATTFAWVFFRAADLSSAWLVISRMAGGFIVRPGQLLALPGYLLGLAPVFFIAIMLMAEWVQRSRQHALQDIGRKLNAPLRWTVYYAILLVVIYCSGDAQTFIYFQF